jgi:adenine-specific DNA glycosylase
MTDARPQTAAPQDTGDGAGRFHRTLGVLPATAVNMTQMCGIGPFITIPLIVAAMGGPQAVLGGPRRRVLPRVRAAPPAR